MKSTRRWFQYSLRSFLILVTALAIWLGVVVNRAREQREAVKAIEALGGFAQYDWQYIEPSTDEPPGPAWLRRIVGDDAFQRVKYVHFFPDPPESKIVKSIPYIQRLARVERVWIWPHETGRLQDVLESALPNCEIRLLGEP